MNLVNMHENGVPRFIVLFFIIRLCVFFWWCVSQAPHAIQNREKSTNPTVAGVHRVLEASTAKANFETPRVTMTPMRT